MASLVYMVAGLSSRFGGRIKQFVKITDNETLIEYSLNQALKSGFNKIIFIVGKNTEQFFKDKFNHSYKGVPVYYAFQDFDANKRDKPWGTVDALCSIIPLIKEIKEPFVVCNGDDIYGKNSFKILYEHLKNGENNIKENKEDATIGYKLKNVLPEKGSVNRGIFKTSQSYVTDIKEVFNIEKNNLSEKNLNLDDLCSMNIFALFPETIEKLNGILKIFKEEYKDNKKIECLLPVELSNLIKKNEIKMKIYPTNDKWLGITNPEDEFIVRDILKNS